jgi:hypothetical protein
MKRLDVEEWAYRVITSVERKLKVEDDRVELKGYWPEARDIARQLGGHANTSRGEPILWLLGVDEKKGIVSFKAKDIAAWHSQLEGEFEGGAPAMQHYNLEWSGQPFVACLFHTDAPPYVVRNPKRSEPKSGPIDLEVPWHAGGTRSARRSELVLLLRPVARLPIIDPVGGEVRINREGYLFFRLYCYGASEEQKRILIPRATAVVHLSPSISIDIPEVELDADGNDPDVIRTKSHLSVNGAGKFICQGPSSAAVSLDYAQTIHVEVSLRIADASRDAHVRARMSRTTPDGPTNFALWTYAE